MNICFNDNFFHKKWGGSGRPSRPASDGPAFDHGIFPVVYIYSVLNIIHPVKPCQYGLLCLLHEHKCRAYWHGFHSMVATIHPFLDGLRHLYLRSKMLNNYFIV